ncbi:HNH endonuclease [Paenibacillus sp. 1_12]|uniref:HNH endonuclease n=1 Tax=Paenibacillus sp. 1_12 TaxID=1566278 RepID=UPI0008E2D578|nr:HNH endonuclease [Paenibacillus sp. 1_12]SFL20902.1 HNH endonuclease [Paenibacillus sp. 1_12]
MLGYAKDKAVLAKRKEDIIACIRAIVGTPKFRYSILMEPLYDVVRFKCKVTENVCFTYIGQSLVVADLSGESSLWFANKNHIVCLAEGDILYAQNGRDTSSKRVLFDGVWHTDVLFRFGFTMSPWVCPDRYLRKSITTCYDEGTVVMDHTLVVALAMGDVVLLTLGTDGLLEIHHKDGHKTNNSPANLEIVWRYMHKSLHGENAWKYQDERDELQRILAEI